MQTIKMIVLYSLVFIAQGSYHAVQAKGNLITDSIYATSLEGNILGDPVKRELMVYLPPGYETSAKQYPVIYLLHTGGGNAGFYPNNVFPPLLEVTGMFTKPQDFPEEGFVSLMDSLIIKGKIHPLILVMPDINSAYGGSFCVNSALNGNYEDYVVNDLVAFTDSKYRTLLNRNSRAIAGHCMGGYGATYLAMKYPDVFGAMAGHSPELCLDALARACQPYIAAENPEGISGPDPTKPFTGFMYMFSAAYSPNLANPPYYVDLPFDTDCSLKEDILQKWADYDPIQLLSAHITELQSLQGIYYDVGDADELQSSYFLTPFIDALSMAGISNTFELFEGTHFSKMYTRLVASLEYLSGVLVHSDEGPTEIDEGNVSGKWTAARSPFHINGEITIPDSETLIIEPGVNIIFKGHYKFNVQGRLLAEGTAQDSIKFTANDLSAGWHGIRFINTPTTNDSSIFEYCILEYGKANSGDGLNNRSGGAMAIIGTDKVRVSHCLFQNNLCYHSNMELSAGGAILITGSPLIEFNEFRNNSGRYGGAITIYYDGSDPLVKNNYIHHNSGHGTINIGASAEPLLLNNIIVQNQTDYHGHIHFANSGGTAVFINNTIANNKCSGTGGGIFINHGLAPLFINNIIHGNTPSQVQLETSSGLDFYYCLLEGGKNKFSGQPFTGTYQNNIDADPLFVDAEGGDFHLSDNSPCISVGTNSIEIAGTWYNAPSSDYDLNQKPLPSGTTPDIGACESALGYLNPLTTENRKLSPQESEMIQVYPNPASNLINLKFRNEFIEQFTVLVMDVSGKIIFSETLKPSQSDQYMIDLSELQSGIYFCQIQGKEYKITKKILLMN